ncbi:MAG: EAL domain-containing protein [Nitrospiraceae bacterium]|nr:EAL domain-containing protein [Nitrospiraceae bacterium]
MKRKIIISLLLLFLLSASGGVLATYYIADTTTTLSRLITLHQIEDLRQNLIMSIQTVQSDLYTIHTRMGHKLDTIVDNVNKLDADAMTCSGCHHVPEVAADIKQVQDLVDEYQNSLSYYITVSANKRLIDRYQFDAANIGNQLLEETGAMSARASKRLERTTKEVMVRIRQAQFILGFTIIATLLLGAVVAFHLIRSVSRPIQALVNATRVIAMGDLGHTVQTDDRTEFGELVNHFNHMSGALKENYEELTEEIKERRQAEKALRESEERYALAAQGANDGLWDWDISKNDIHYSSRWKTMLGYGETELGNQLDDWFDLIHDDDRETVKTKLLAHIDGHSAQFEAEYRIRHKSGAYRWVLARGVAVRDESAKAYRMAGSQTDITPRKDAEAQLIHDAFHDSLTQLPNRALFMDRLEHVIDTTRRHTGHLYAVLFIDLDRFKVVNDSMGHPVGDALLIEVSRRLKETLRPGDTVARLGGDEFSVLLEDLLSPEDIREVAERILHMLSDPYIIQKQELIITPSIGIAVKSPNYDKPEQILRDADIAMYQAKTKGRARYEFFDADMLATILDRLQLEGDLRIAVEHHAGMMLHYQPIMAPRNSRLIGFEALVRWNHPKRGMIYPLEFIPLAEETGIIMPLSDWILEEAVKQLEAWQRLFPADPPLTMSMNISSRQFLQPGFVDKVRKVLKRHSIPDGSFAIEITESVLMEQSEAAVQTIEQLRDMHVQIHIDDFGTGYSSLSYLHNFPVNALKIDRSFIEKISGNNDNLEIIRAIMALAQSLNLEVIAEGVEKDHQLSVITDMDCKYCQGFFFSKPLSPEALEQWIRSDTKYLS